MPRRIDLGRALLALGAALLFASLFTDWYDDGLSAWDAFEVLDLLLLALAAGAVVVALRPDEAPRWAAIAIPATALVVVVVQLLNPPPAAAGADPSTGAWLALAGALVMALGAAIALARISVTVQVRGRDVRRRVPAVDRREADAEPRGPSGGAAVSALDVDDLDLDEPVVERTQPLRALPNEDDAHGEEPTSS